MMLQKKKEDRPIITDLIDYLRDRQKVKHTFSPLDQSNYQNYKSLSVKQFETKRVKEKNMNSYNKDFDALKKRIQQGNKDFKNVMLKQQASFQESRSRGASSFASQLSGTQDNETKEY